MSDTDHTNDTLSPSAAALLTAWMQSRPVLQPPSDYLPETALLTRYLCVVLPSQEPVEIERNLPPPRQARAQIRKVRRLLDFLQNMSWEQEESWTPATDMEDLVARTWQEIRADLLAAAPEST